ncbi:MAG: hypothetical protein ACFCVG_01670 [Kineosporiaceae bacterium]
MVAVAGLAVVLGVGGVAYAVRGDGLGPVVAAGERTAAAGSARVEILTLLDGGVGQPKQRIDATGVVDFASSARYLDFRVGPAQTEVPDGAGGVALSVVEVDGDSYYRYASWDAGQPWLRTTGSPDDPDDSAGEAGLGSLALDDVVLGNRWDVLRDGVVDVRELGEETVRGERTRRYSVDVDLSRVALDPELGDALQRVARQGMVLDVWVSDRIHRVRYVLDAGSANVAAGDAAAGPAGGVGPGASVATVIEYHDFGVPAAIEAPGNALDDTLTGGEGEGS